jgi:type II secretory ATPase GspE/PulE/Tfp pilus assembly ATPase PilB-like protein
MLNNRAQLGTILKEHGVISQEQLDAALRYQQERGCALGEALMGLDLCTDVDVARALAEQNDLPFVDLQQTPPSGQALRLISREVAVEYGIVPVRVEGKRLLVAARNPYDFRIDEVVRNATRMTAVVASAAESQLKELLGRYDQLKYAPSAPAVVSQGTYRPGSRFSGSAPMGLDLIPASEQASTVRKVNSLIADAVRRRARDIYFEPGDDVLRVRVRIDGVVHPLTTVPQHEMNAVLARLTAMCGISVNVTQKGGPLPVGSCQVRVEGRTIPLGASVVGGASGNVLVMRNRGQDSRDLPIESLGMEPEMVQSVRRLMARRQGLLLISGPVGSGRPTTLYSLLTYLQLSGSHAYALEHSFERKLSGVSRIQAGDHGVQSFSTALATALNQRPDAMLVGDLPDKETAEVACRAAASGQLVIAGSLAPDSLTAITRLLDLGVAPAVVAGAVSAVVGQRLLRRVCDSCARESRLSFQLQRALRTHYTIPKDALYRKGRGCAECHRIGTRGQTGVFELLELDEDLRALVAQRALPSFLREAIAERSFRTLEEDAFGKICRGVMPPDEMVRLGGKVAETMAEISAKEAAAPEPDEDIYEEPAAEEPQVLELVTWDQVAEMAKFLDD